MNRDDSHDKEHQVQVVEETSSGYKQTRKSASATLANSKGILKSIVRSILKKSSSIFASARKMLRKLTRAGAPDIDGGDANNPTCGKEAPSGEVLAVSMPDAETAEDLARLEQHMDDHPPVTLIVDSGADFHVVGNRDLLLDIVGSNVTIQG